METINSKTRASVLKKIAKKAGDEILKVYQEKDFSSIVDFKADDSPLTLADKLSHEVIDAMLKKEFPGIPVLSEEGKDIAYEERKKWDTFWLVDPLDGTKEFIKRNGEFTVNIALIEQNRPVLGIIYAPVLETFYFGEKGNEAWKEVKGALSALRTTERKTELVAVGSRSHSAPEEEQLLKAYGVKELVSKGSSLKFCMVAEGQADIYYRHGPTMEWDTAAGQAILEAAGGAVLDMQKNPFTYNKQSLLNGSFLCLNSMDLLR